MFFSVTAESHLQDTDPEKFAAKRAFDDIWKRLEGFRFPKGVDPKAVRVRYTGRLASISRPDAFVELMRAMADELGISHFHVIGRDELGPEKKNGRIGWAGCTVDLIEGTPVIVRVQPGSPADRANLRPGMVVKSVLNRSWEEIRLYVKGKSPNIREEVAVRDAFDSFVYGTRDERLDLGIKDDASREFSVRLRFEDPPGVWFEETDGSLRGRWVTFEHRVLAGEVHYIRFNTWSYKPLREQLRRALSEARLGSGLVLDLRGNGGGESQMISWLLGALSPAGSAGGVIGYEVQADTGKIGKPRKEPIRFAPAFPYCDRPLAVLVDCGSASASEVFAAAVQDTKKGLVIGQQTAGAVLMSQFVEIPGRFRMQTPVSDYETVKGRRLEGQGVVPDFPIKMTRQQLISEGDSIPEYARQMILVRPKSGT